jgi:tetratricopeptide (TPR) repeat protein
MWLLVTALLLAAQSNPYKDAGAALASGDLAAAQASLEALTVKDPGNARAWMLLAQTYARRKNTAAALAAASKSETLGARDPEVLRGLAFLFTDLQPDLKRAATELSASVQLAPYDENAQFLLIQFYLQHEDFTQASAAIARARKIFARSPQIELAAGVCAYGMRRFPEALDQFLKTIALAPDVPQSYLFLGRMLDHAADRLPEIVERFSQFHARHPDDPAACLLYAKALIAALDPAGFPPQAEQAMQLLEHARSLDGNQAETHYQIGCLLERKHDDAAAASELEQSVALDPREPGAHFHLARVYQRLGRKEDALRQRDLHQKLTELAAAPGSPETRIQDLLDDVARSGRVLESGDLADRLGAQRQIAPGRPPILEFRYLEGAARRRFGSLDLVIDDAGH